MAKKANITKTKTRDIPLVYRIERGGPSASKDTAAISKIAKASIKTSIDQLKELGKQRGQRIMDMPFVPHPSATVSGDASQISAVPDSLKYFNSAHSNWRIIAPPYDFEDHFSIREFEGHREAGRSEASKVAGTLFESFDGPNDDDKYATLGIRLTSPERVAVNISPIGIYEAAIDAQENVKNFDAFATFIFIVDDGSPRSKKTTAAVCYLKSAKPGTTRFVGTFADLIAFDPVIGNFPLFPYNFTMEANKNYDLLLQMHAFQRTSPDELLSFVFGVSCRILYFFLSATPA
jgi:hypothetical protein